MWETHSTPSIYLWPYDIPYSRSDELRKIIVDRVGDLPAFFGMDPKEAKDHQERMLSRILFGSVVVHVVFISSPDSKERNSEYAKFCTFGEMIAWSQNLKKVMDARFLHNRSKSHHILVVISPEDQVIVSREEIAKLNELIGSSNSKDYKPFRACYFLDLNLEPGEDGRVIHSKYMWDVLVGRFLLALLLSQEKSSTAENEKDSSRKPLWEQHAGVKVWRAADCAVSVKRDSSQAVLKDAMEKAAKQLLEDLVSRNTDGARLELLKDVSIDRNSLDYKLVPRWPGDELNMFDGWSEKQNASFSTALSSKAFYHDWSSLSATRYTNEVKSPEHWQASFEELARQRISWGIKQESADYTPAVEDFFSIVRKNPGELGGFITQILGKMTTTHKKLKENHSDPWTEIIDAEKKRQEMIKQLDKDSKEFKKAQNYYIGRGLALLVLVSVTVFLGWMICQILRLFGVGPLKIFLSCGFIFAGGAAAYFLIMLLHNFTGNRAAGKIMAECLDIEREMWKRDDRIREMFFDGIEKRNVLSLQHIRFKTRLLAKRTLSILQTELQPQLSSLLETGADTGSRHKISDAADTDHVRDAYLKFTRSSIGPLQIEKIDLKDDFLSKYLTGDGPDSFLSIWKDLCSEDQKHAGYFPAKIFISRIRSFVAHFLGNIHHFIFEKSLQKSEDNLKKDFLKFVETVQHIGDDGSLLSAALPAYSGRQTKILFINASFFNYCDQNKDTHGIHEYQSELLETTRTAALFYQEFDVDFDLKPISESSGTDSGHLTFKIVPKERGV